MPYTKYNLFYKRLKRKPRSTEYRQRKGPKLSKINTHKRKEIQNNNRLEIQTDTPFENLNTIFGNDVSLDTNESNSQTEQLQTPSQSEIDQINIQYINNNNRDDHDDDDDNDANQEILCQALVSLSYAANMTHSALSLVAEFTQLVTNFSNIPKKFRDLSTRVTNDKINYDKIWYCQSCLFEVQLSKPSQRECMQCATR